ncbi:hypothetical protein FXF51_46470 [Nonomuraea sp. PA05]|uniref:DUF6193 family natural product biosynthesis protein n=1 Tax=Nonomuraea sp. PA05 TaxID=2604466 RepID=UPI0011D85536|nr:DUF6193 family natural product biosynthesis protein [Nonomuraea sp. PA05]TYB55110.1 hypothetical protein FXF51_46470 [Nonomuraea sp. PA05]
MSEREVAAEPVRSVEAVVRPGLYPDLLRAGGLAPALREVAHALNIAIGAVVEQQGDRWHITAKIESGRGTMSILIGAEMRLFSINISHGTFSWAHGSSDSLEDVVRVAEAWRADVTLQELIRRFPFMDYNEVAASYENGTPIEGQWERLFADPDLIGMRKLLRSAHERRELALLFPYVSHMTLRFIVDPYVRSGATMSITPISAGSIRVEILGMSDTRREVPSVDDAVELAVAYSSVLAQSGDE